MIQHIALDNFKCFAHQELALRRLNVFSGVNGMGKSTMIQAVLLLAQAYIQDFLPHQVNLNGEFVHFGSGRDIFYEAAEQDQISICLNINGKMCPFVMLYDEFADLLRLDEREYDSEALKIFRHMDYLSAERIAPQDLYGKSSYEVEHRSRIGNKGEYALHYLSSHMQDPVDKKFFSYFETSDDGHNFILGEAVQYWLQVVSPGIRFDIQTPMNLQALQLQYYYQGTAVQGSIKSNMYRPTNVGFGITYVLPVLVALLKAKKDDILLLENPEAHLHPHGQRMMGELIALCAKGGTQIFMETHSDHVLNGIRIAVKKKRINAEDVSMCFFYRQDKQHCVKTLEMDGDGRLEEWPDGFFDEWDKALDEIL